MFIKLIISAVLLYPLTHTVAQESSTDSAENPLEEIVISGYRLGSLLELDTSLTVLDADTIDSTGMEHFEQLVQLVPNMNFSGEGSRARYFQLRGVGEREQYEGAPNPSVAYIIDDIDLSGIGGVGSLYDISQVEILRGPQSARYGSSALAGVVYMRSQDPTHERSADAEISTGNDGLFSLSAAMGGAITSKLIGRFSLHHFQNNGFRDNIFLGQNDTAGRQELSARGKLRWEFKNNWEALLTGLVMDFDNGYDAWTVNNDDIVHSDNPGEDSQKTRAGSLRVKGPINQSVDFVSISSFADSDILFSYDGDWGNDNFWQEYGDYVYDYSYINPRQRQSYGQEFRLLSSPQARLFNDSTDWVIGVSWQGLDEDNDISSTGTYDDSGEENFCAPCSTDRQISSQYRADTLAIFTSLDSKLSDKTGLSLGLRYEHWDASYDDDWNDVSYPGVPASSDSCSQFDCDPSESLWGGHIALSHDFKSELRGYMRIARGFKAGGFNPSLAALQGVARLGPEFIPYEAETLWNVEMGLKAVWLDGSLTTDITIFHMDRDDAQLSQSSQQVEFDPNSFVYVTYNGAARVNGLEFSSSWQLNETWQLQGSLGLLDSKIQDNEKTAAVSTSAIGRDLAHAPGYTFNFGVLYRDTDGWFGRLDFNAVDSFYFDISHEQQSRAYQLVNLRVGKQWNKWEIAAWGRNIFDQDYSTRGFFFGNEPPAFANTLYRKFGDPRSYGLSLSYGFY